VRFLSLADFEEFCAEKGIAIHQIVALDTHAGCRVDGEPNLNANVVIAVMSK